MNKFYYNFNWGLGAGNPEEHRAVQHRPRAGGGIRAHPPGARLLW